jgi:hypothetical protein
LKKTSISPEEPKQTTKAYIREGSKFIFTQNNFYNKLQKNFENI